MTTIDPYAPYKDMTCGEYAIIMFASALLPHNEISAVMDDAILAARTMYKKLIEAEKDGSNVTAINKP